MCSSDLFASLEVNQGKLTLERSEPGVGTCFALDLPLAKSKPVQPFEVAGR